MQIHYCPALRTVLVANRPGGEPSKGRNVKVAKRLLPQRFSSSRSQWT